MSKQLKLALGAGALATAAVIASAATLGDVTSTQLGAGTTVVASCDNNGVDVSYTTAYNVVAKAYQVTGVTLKGVDAACNNQNVKITLYQVAAAAPGSSPDGAVIGTAEATSANFTAPTALGTATFPVTGITPVTPATTPVTYVAPTAAAVTGVAVVISSAA